MSYEIAFLKAILGALPNFDRALCAGRPELFTIPSGDKAAERRAVSMCLRCPALGTCTAHLACLPAKLRPTGMVMAAKLIGERGEPRKR